MCIIEWVESVYSQSIRTGTFLILALIGIVFVLSLLFSKRKKVHLTLLIFMVVFYIFAKVHCGASLKDVSVMKPMAEAISNYIVKNGIPKSLEDIPDLPYELEGCKKKIKYPYLKKQKINPTLKEAKMIVYIERCSIQDKSISIEYFYEKYSKDINKQTSIGIGIKMENTNTNTGSRIGLIKTRNKKFMIDEKFTLFSRKKTGICNPMRQ